MSFSEDISGLIDRSNREKMDSTTGNMLANEMTINLNMFGAIMKDIIVSNLKSTVIVTKKFSSTRGGNTQISKKPTKPEKFLSSISKSTVFGLSTGTSSKRLFLAGPRNKRITQKKAEPGSRPAVSRISSPISIGKGTKLERGAGGIMKTMKHGAFEIPKDMK
ncbi:hypothetical protein CsSME_00027002 [Camellia sinensis var. sinensis]